MNGLKIGVGIILAIAMAEIVIAMRRKSNKNNGWYSWSKILVYVEFIQNFKAVVCDLCVFGVSLFPNEFSEVWWALYPLGKDVDKLFPFFLHKILAQIYQFDYHKQSQFV